MSGDIADSRRLARLLLRPVDWAVAEKCALILGIFLGFTVWVFAAAAFFVVHLESAPYLDPAALAIEVRVLAIQGFLIAALLWWVLAATTWSAPTSNARSGPAPGTGGLRRESVALCHQVTTLDRAKLVEPIGGLPATALRRLNDGLRAALALL